MPLSKVLVLGSNSFGASHLIDDLLNDNCRVIGVSRSKLKSHIFLMYLKNKNVQNFSFHQIDLLKQYERLISLIKRERPEFIVDLAGQGMVAESWRYPEAWYQTNVIIKVRLLEFLRNQSAVEKYIRVSTPEVYGSSEKEIYESTRLNPSTPYALSHATIDRHLELLNSQYGFPSVVGRFANFYGRGQQLYRIVPKTFIKFKSREELYLHGGGLSKRSFIYGTDVSLGILKMMHLGSTGNVYHFSTRELFSIKEVVQLIGDELGIEWKSLIKITEERPGNDQQYFMNISKSMNELDWTPNVGLKEGLTYVHSWIEAHLDIFSKSSLEYKHAP